MRMWNAGMDYLDGCNIGLDGVVTQQTNYQMSGFNLAYRNIRYQGVGGGELPADPEIIPLSIIPFDKLCVYDNQFFPDNRTSFLKCWINQPQSAALGILRNNVLSGYGVIRACRSGFKIGPMFADTPELAEILFSALKSHAPERSSVFLDVPEVNGAAIELVNRHKMSYSFETARMYTGQNPDLPLTRLYGVTSFELG